MFPGNLRKKALSTLGKNLASIRTSSELSRCRFSSRRPFELPRNREGRTAKPRGPPGRRSTRMRRELERSVKRRPQRAPDIDLVWPRPVRVSAPLLLLRDGGECTSIFSAAVPHHRVVLTLHSLLTSGDPIASFHLPLWATVTLLRDESLSPLPHFSFHLLSLRVSFEASQGAGFRRGGQGSGGDARLLFFLSLSTERSAFAPVDRRRSPVSLASSLASQAELSSLVPLCASSPASVSRHALHPSLLSSLLPSRGGAVVSPLCDFLAVLLVVDVLLLRLLR